MNVQDRQMDTDLTVSIPLRGFAPRLERFRLFGQPGLLRLGFKRRRYHHELDPTDATGPTNSPLGGLMGITWPANALNMFGQLGSMFQQMFGRRQPQLRERAILLVRVGRLRGRSASLVQRQHLERRRQRARLVRSIRSTAATSSQRERRHPMQAVSPTIVSDGHDARRRNASNARRQRQRNDHAERRDLESFAGADGPNGQRNRNAKSRTARYK